MQNILADVAVSVSELKKNPSAVLSGANGLPVAVIALWVTWSLPTCTRRWLSAWTNWNWFTWSRHGSMPTKHPFEYLSTISSARPRQISPMAVEDGRIVILVLAVGKRERSSVYDSAKSR